MIRIFTSFLLFVMALSCGLNSSKWRDVARAEALAQDKPDVALAILDSIGYVQFPKKIGARIELARTNCMYFIDSLRATDDSILNNVISYYESQNDKSRLHRAYFLRGHIYVKSERYGDGLVDFLRAERYASEVGDSTALGLIYRGMGEIYYCLGDMNSALAYMKNSYDIFRSIQSDRYLDWATFDYALSLSNALKYNEAIQILVDLFASSGVKENEYLKNQIFLLLGCVYNYIDRHSDATIYFQNYRISDNPDANRRYFLHYGRSLLELGRQEEARAMQDSLTKYFPNEHYLKLLLATREGDKDEVVAQLKTGVTEQNEELTNLYRREFVSIIDRYYKEQQVAADLRAQRQRTVIWFILGFVVLLSALIWILERRRRAERRETRASLKLLEENVMAAERARRESEEAGARRLDEISQHVLRLIRARIEEAEAVCRQIPPGKREDKVMKQVRRALTDLAPGSEYIKELENTVDDVMNGLMSDFRRDYPNLKETDYAMFMYAVLKLSTPVCSAVLQITPGTYYTRKSRLRSRLAVLPDTGRYLKYIDAI